MRNIAQKLHFEPLPEAVVVSMAAITAAISITTKNDSECSCATPIVPKDIPTLFAAIGQALHCLEYHTMDIKTIPLVELLIVDTFAIEQIFEPAHYSVESVLSGFSCNDPPATRYLVTILKKYFVDRNIKAFCDHAVESLTYKFYKRAMKQWRVTERVNALLWILFKRRESSRFFRIYNKCEKNMMAYKLALLLTVEAGCVEDPTLLLESISKTFKASDIDGMKMPPCCDGGHGLEVSKKIKKQSKIIEMLRRVDIGEDDCLNGEKEKVIGEDKQNCVNINKVINTNKINGRSEEDGVEDKNESLEMNLSSEGGKVTSRDSSMESKDSSSRESSVKSFENDADKIFCDANKEIDLSSQVTEAGINVLNLPLKCRFFKKIIDELNAWVCGAVGGFEDMSEWYAVKAKQGSWEECVEKWAADRGDSEGFVDAAMIDMCSQYRFFESGWKIFMHDSTVKKAPVGKAATLCMKAYRHTGDDIWVVRLAAVMRVAASQKLSQIFCEITEDAVRISCKISEEKRKAVLGRLIDGIVSFDGVEDEIICCALRGLYTLAVRCKGEGTGDMCVEYAQRVYSQWKEQKERGSFLFFIPKGKFDQNICGSMLCVCAETNCSKFYNVCQDILNLGIEIDTDTCNKLEAYHNYKHVGCYVCDPTTEPAKMGKKLINHFLLERHR